MFVLRTSDLQWVDGSTDNPWDQCAHGRVDFRIGNSVFIRPNDEIWTVSAAALYLMRTLERNHSPQDSVAPCSSLFPHDGFSFSVCRVDDEVGFVCFGGPPGIDPEVTHYRDRIYVHLAAKKAVVSYKEWKAAVFNFADEVLDFYRQCAPREDPDDDSDRMGWQLFWQEWAHRRRQSRGAP